MSNSSSTKKYWVIFDPYVYGVEESAEKPYGAVSGCFSTYQEAQDCADEMQDEREKYQREMNELYGTPNA